MSRVMMSSARRMEGLSDTKARLLKHLLEQKARAGDAITSGERIVQGGVARAALSWAQQRLWFIHQYDGGSASYNVPLSLRLRGPLDGDALARALENLVRRHEVLRTVFIVHDGTPFQEIRPDPFQVMSRVDLSGCSKDELDRTIQEHKVREAHEPFDLAIGPLIRASLLYLGGEEHVLLITMHHIICDGWSLGVFATELERSYNAYVRNEVDPLPALKIQYADYAQWQRRWFQGKEFDRQLQYWRELLDGAPQIELPTDRARPPRQSYRGGNLPVRLETDLCNRLRDVAKRHDLTMFMVLLAGWAILLSRLSGQEDLVIGTPTANRRRPELERLIGFFVNTLALRILPADGMSLEHFYAHIREATLQAYAHQDMPFERIVEAVQPERSVNRSPLFQVMLALQNSPRRDLQLERLTVLAEPGVDEPSIFDLFLSLEERGQEVVGSLSYASDIFERDTMERWMRYFNRLLEEMARSSTASIDRLCMLPQQEFDRVTRTFNDTAVALDCRAFIHQRFEEQARQAPDRPAVVHKAASISYGELDAKANLLASYLRQRGVMPGKLVGICLERSIDMIVAVLAAMKAGGAYVPLDPSYPADRLHYMVEDASPTLILTQSNLLELFCDGSQKVVVLSDGFFDELASELVGLPDRQFDEDSPAERLIYVIYTSGSTGHPKGTAMPHGAMINLIEWHRDTFRARGHQRVLQFAALSFDVAFQEIFSTLCTGSTLHLLDEWVRRDARALLQLLVDRSIQRLFMPPMMLQAIAEACRTSDVLPYELTDVIVAGEQLRISPEIVCLFERLGDCRLHNHYGPTETHVVTSLTLEGNSIHWPVLPSIGRPLWNCKIYILDRGGEVVPMGVVGEIYIGGAGLARGYLGRTELTKQRFVDKALTSPARERLYRTGDTGRWFGDGTIEYLGRNDDQVKIRGYRIELGEIESQLLRQNAVREAAVIAREDVPGDKRLIAYVAFRSGVATDVEALKRDLAESLPQFMVPSAFVVLDALPLTPSGKLNRRALPAPDASVYARRQYEPPQGVIEHTLAAIWGELLRIDQVGRQDNFFELGGHSLLGMQLIAKVTERCGVQLPVIAIFQHPTVQRLSAAIQDLRESAGDDPTRMEFDEGTI